MKDSSSWQGFSVITAQELMTRQFPPPRWAIPDLLPEGLTVLAGKPKCGKSWLALNIAFAVASGGQALGYINVQKGEVLYLALEDSPRRLQGRLGKMTDKVPPLLHLTCDFPCMMKGGMAELEK